MTATIGLAKKEWTPGQYTDYYLSSESITVSVRVTTKNGKIIESPPVVRRFIGQPLNNLIAWMAKQGGLKIECGQEYTPELRLPK